MECYDLFIKFFDSWDGVWYGIKAVGYSSAYDCIGHVYFLFHGSWTCYEGLTLFGYFSCGGVDLCFPFERRC